ncbi:hypothetical protein LN650_16295 [Klebsiella pneumoniae subsp. pneumoniae]|nr:hypothetical protein [Klebsiella pneumoniae subsp. pneumoniae]
MLGGGVATAALYLALYGLSVQAGFPDPCPASGPVSRWRKAVGSNPSRRQRSGCASGQQLRAGRTGKRRRWTPGVGT